MFLLWIHVTNLWQTYCIFVSFIRLFCDSAHKGSTWAPEDIILSPCVSCPCHLIRFCQISPSVLFLIYVDDWYQFRKFPLWPGPVGLFLSIQGEVWAQSVWPMMAGCSRKKGPHLSAKRPFCPWPCSGVEIYIFPKIIRWNRLYKWLHIHQVFTISILKLATFSTVQTHEDNKVSEEKIMPIHPSIHFLSLMSDRAAVTAGLRGRSRPPSPQQNFPTAPGGLQGSPHASWDMSSLQASPGSPPGPLPCCVLISFGNQCVESVSEQWLA